MSEETQENPSGSDTMNSLVRCRTMLCGRQAIAYTTDGPKCEICMERNNNKPLVVIPKWYPKLDSLNK